MVQNWEDVPMVELPEPAPLRLPKSASPGTGAVSYATTSLKQRCEDCMELYTEHHRDGEALPAPARMAKWERKQAGHSRLLCYEHKRLRQELEARR